MGVLQLPFMAVWTCVRGAALALIISYGLWLKVWRSLQPSLTPILDIYHSIDLALVNLITIAEQIVKTLAMMWALYWRMALSAWRLVTGPFGALLDWALQYLQALDEEFSVTGTSRSVLTPRKVAIRSPEHDREAHKRSPAQGQGEGQGEVEADDDQGVELD